MTTNRAEAQRAAIAKERTEDKRTMFAKGKLRTNFYCKNGGQIFTILIPSSIVIHNQNPS